MPEDTVNIRIKTETWKRMRELKDEPGKTWDDVITELLDEAEEGNPKRRTAATAD